MAHGSAWVKLASVFSVSSFYVVTESSYSSKGESNSLLVAWSLNCFSAAISTESTVVSFKTSALEEAVMEVSGCSALLSSCGLLLCVNWKLSVDFVGWHYSIRIYSIYKYCRSLCLASNLYKEVWCLDLQFHLKAFQFMTTSCSLWTRKLCIFNLFSLSYYA